MAIDKVLEFTFGLARREPKILLPNILNWVPTALLTILITQAVLQVGSLVSFENFQTALSNPMLLSQLVGIILSYASIGIPILIVSMLVSIFLTCTYSDITRQAYTGHKVLLTKAFSVSKGRLLPLIWTQSLEALIGILIFVGLIALGALGGGIGIALGLLSGIVFALLLVVFFYVTPAIVVIENKSGLVAIKRSFSIGKRHFWPLSLVMLIVGIAISTVNSAFQSIPYVGFILVSLVGLFLNAWNEMIPAIFYYEYERKRR